MQVLSGVVVCWLQGYEKKTISIISSAKIPVLLWLLARRIIGSGCLHFYCYVSVCTHRHPSFRSDQTRIERYTGSSFHYAYNPCQVFIVTHWHFFSEKESTFCITSFVPCFLQSGCLEKSWRSRKLITAKLFVWNFPKKSLRFLCNVVA